MSIRTKLIIFFSFLFIYVIGNMLYIFKMEEYLEEKLELLKHTNEVILETEYFLSAMKDAETGQRGFLLTEGDNYLEPYNSGVIDAKKHFTKLNALTSEHHTQQERLALVEQLMQLKLDELDMTVHLTQQNNNHNTKALKIVKQDKGKEYMDAIRAHMDEFINEENTLLKERERKYKEYQEMVYNVIIIVIIFFVFLAFVTIIFLNRTLFTPLKLLISYTDKMAKGEKIETIAITSDDEIGHLFSCFFRMQKKVYKRTEELQNYKDKLEIRVEEEIEKNHKHSAYLVQQSRLAQIGEMISMIAHQWRQPLGAISAISINMQMKSTLEDYDLGQKEEAQKYEESINNGLDDIDEIVQGLSCTINDFRDFYKKDKKKSTMTIDKPIAKALKIIETSLKIDSIDINQTYESRIVIDMYESQLMQVFLNLFKNAQDNFKDKHIDDPRIDIKTYDKDNSVIVEIIDNGGGIPKDNIDKIFDPYFSTKGKNGSGLGLYMSKTIIEDHHNGILSVSNTDTGVCFSIEINNDKAN